MGQLIGVEPDSTGTIVARYSNNQTQVMGQVALANFSNPQGLKRTGDNAWIASSESGSEKVGKPTEGMLGQVIAGSLESSNVDMTQQLVKMITAQRNFQANAQVVSVNNQLTQTLLNIR
jgi:flagellar hook protein FlgE